MNYKEHRVAALIGPNGELVLEMCDNDNPDWEMLWNCTDGWPAVEGDIRRAVVTIRVPVTEPTAPLELDSSLEAQ